MPRLVLHARGIKKSYGEREIIAVDDLKIYQGERIGVVGANGAGKSTLLGLLSGRLRPDEGWVELYADTSFIAQEDDGTPVPEPRLAREFKVSGISGEGMSGGERTRLKIAAGLDDQAGILFADEPTANLDMDGIIRLEKKLAGFRGALLLVSHDRELLDHLCRTIFEVEDAGIRVYRGNYSDYLEQREARRERQWFEYEQYVEEKRRLEDRIRERRGSAKKMKKTPTRMGNSEARLHKRSSNEIQEKLNKTVKSMETRLEKLEVKERPRPLPRVKISLPASGEAISKTVVRGEDLRLSYGNRRIFDGAGFELPRGRKTALIGANGAGKTTLAELIVQGGPRIKIAPGTRIGYFRQDLDQDFGSGDTVLESARRDSVQDETLVRTVLARLLFKGDDVHKPVSRLSGGEKVKLSLAVLLLSNANLIILDEPTNYLDLYSLEALEEVLKGYEGTLLLISHDRKFLAATADRALLIEDRAIRTIEAPPGDYYQGPASPGGERDVTDETLLQLRLAELAGRMSGCRDRAEFIGLEEEYRLVLEKLKGR
ncbi:MAG: ABC-F type ribosomal protection protein [Firmicutes bacterium]|nr:ABC-F type ribosomal protection protein [Bacillota bacterium]